MLSEIIYLRLVFNRGEYTFIIRFKMLNRRIDREATRIGYEVSQSGAVFNWEICV